MAPLRADRPLAVTSDRSEVVEETDPRAAYLFVPAGRLISDADADRYGLSERAGRVVIGGEKAAPAPANKMAPAPENKAGGSEEEAEAEEAEAEEEEPAAEDEEDAVSDEEPEWTLSMSPAEYLTRWPEGPNADLAQRIVGG